MALVDVGWGGLIQDSLWRAFGSEPGFPDLVGLYVGLDQFGLSRAASRATWSPFSVLQIPAWHSGDVGLLSVRPRSPAPRAPWDGYRLPMQSSGRSCPGPEGRGSP